MLNLLQCPSVIQGLGWALYRSQSTCLQHVLTVLGAAVPEGFQQLCLNPAVPLRRAKGPGINCKQGGSCFYSTPVDQKWHHSALTLQIHANILIFSYKEGGSFFFKQLSLLKFRIFIPVMELTTERKIVGGLISSFSMLDSVASGKPLSSISSRSSYTITTLSLIAVSEHSPK